MTSRIILRAFPLILCGLLVCAAMPIPVRAQSAELESLASRLLEKIERKGHKRVLVADFAGPDAKLTELGRELGDEFSAALARVGKGLQLLPRANLSAAWNSALDIDLAADVQEGRAARALARRAGAQVAVTGSFKTDGASLELKVRAWDIPPAYGRTEIWDPEKLGEAGTRVSLTAERSALLEKVLLTPQAGTVRLTSGYRRPSAPPERDAKVAAAPESTPPTDLRKPGQNGVSYPKCLVCPNPEPSDEARQKRMSGAVVLEVTITPEGTARDVKVLRSAGYGLDEKALEAVRTWKFQPAMGLDGKPVPVRVNVEVTFRIQ